jgi:ribosomal protein S18 acetylase RimI-like enzyme
MIGAEWKQMNHLEWLAFDGKKLIGICSVVINPELKTVGKIDNLAVLRKYHHRGIGRALLGFGIQSLIEKGCKTIELGVDADNEKALSLYKKFGFHEVESRTNFVYAIE